MPHHPIVEAPLQNLPADREEGALAVEVEDMEDTGEGAEEAEDIKQQNTKGTELQPQKKSLKGRQTI